jgi:hypothetical protein
MFFYGIFLQFLVEEKSKLLIYLLYISSETNRTAARAAIDSVLVVLRKHMDNASVVDMAFVAITGLAIDGECGFFSSRYSFCITRGLMIIRAIRAITGITVINPTFVVPASVISS